MQHFIYICERKIYWIQALYIVCRHGLLTRALIREAATHMHVRKEIYIETKTLRRCVMHMLRTGERQHFIYICERKIYWIQALYIVCRHGLLTRALNREAATHLHVRKEIYIETKTLRRCVMHMLRTARLVGGSIPPALEELRAQTQLEKRAHTEHKTPHTPHTHTHTYTPHTPIYSRMHARLRQAPYLHRDATSMKEKGKGGTRQLQNPPHGTTILR